MSQLDYQFRTAKDEDAKEISKIHLESFSDGFLVNLGNKFIIRMYKFIISKSPIKIIVTDSNHKILGFAIGGCNDSVMRCLRPIDLIFFIKKSLTNLNILKQLFSRVIGLYFSKNINSETLNKDGNEGDRNFGSEIELSHIAMTSLKRSLGIGANLIREFENEAKKLGMSVISTRTHNKKLCNYYKKNKNAYVASTIQSKNEISYVLKWRIINEQ